MTEQAFSKLKSLHPLINELCEALGLELDAEYYIEKNRYETGLALAKKYFSKGTKDKQSLLFELSIEFPKIGAAEAVIRYWVQQKIVKDIGKEIYERVRNETEVAKSREMIESILGKIGSIPKNDLIAILSHLGIEAHYELDYLLRHKIISEGFAVFGTKRQERKEIVYLGDCPY